MIILSGNGDIYSLIDSFLFIVLGFLVYKGYRLAMIVAMLAWTIERLVMFFVGITRYSTVAGSRQIIVVIISLFWWAIYMQFLYAAFKVENLRKKAMKEFIKDNESTTAADHYNKFSKIEEKDNKGAIIKTNYEIKNALIILFPFSLIFLSLFAGLFYWFQLRPAQIKHDCSWVKHHTDAITAKEGLTENQLKAKGMLKPCPPYLRQEGVGIFEYWKNEPQCNIDNDNTIEKYKPVKYVPAKDWWVKATKDEYAFCLHNNGL